VSLPLADTVLEAKAQFFDATLHSLFEEFTNEFYYLSGIQANDIN
jgi:hypothetical protein